MAPKTFKSPVDFILPDFSQCGSAAAGIVPSWISSIDFCKTVIAGDKQEGGAWKFQFYAFWEDLPVCCWFLCCPMCTSGRTLEAIDGRPYEAHCLNSCCAFCLGPCYVGKIRSEFRKKYNIAGSSAEDLLCACCLSPCLACHFAREAHDREGFTIPLTKELGAKLPAALAPNGQVATRQVVDAPATEAATSSAVAPAPKAEAWTAGSEAAKEAEAKAGEAKEEVKEEAKEAVAKEEAK